jgi:hypothetical protein
MTNLLSIALLLNAAVPLAASDVDYQQVANDVAWEWHPERSGLLNSLLTAPPEYDITVTRPKDTFGELTIRFKTGEKTDYSWTGHLDTMFLVNDKVLYYAEYNPHSDGCTVAAYDLADKKELWKTRLKGLGPILHFRYSNAVEMDFFGYALRIYGDESAGKYVEYVDLKEGKTVGHKIFK